MRVGEIIRGYNGKYKRREVKNLAFRLEKVEDGTLFFDLRNDAPTARKALAYGAAAVVRTTACKSLHSQILVDNARSALALASKFLYGSACDKANLYAITGTNGKTTTAFMLREILQKNGKECALISTNGIYIGSDYYPNALTTPDPTDLHAIIYECVCRGIKHIVMEASAHALRLRKLDGITFKVAAFTNLSRDHLDFFADLSDYKNAKLALMRQAESIVTNAGDEVGREIAAAYHALKYGEGGEVFAEEISLCSDKSEFLVYCGENKVKCRISILGRYNIDNALCAIAMALRIGIPLRDAVGALESMQPVSGRMNIIRRGEVSVVIDFAHTDDGLRNLLTAVRGFTKGRIITVFGCGGNRDKDKRPIMGRVASTLSDMVVLTDDNPRNERSEDIIADISKGIKGKKEVDYYIRPGREQAVRFAISAARNGDTVVLAGKGAEDYIEINGEKIPYSDRVTAEVCLKERFGD